jgi:hypothetical protein
MTILPRSLGTLALPALLAAAGCAEPEPTLGTTSAAVTVAGSATGTCSTAAVLGLSRQIADEIACMNPGTLTAFTAGDNIQVTSNAVLPYLDAKARTDLLATTGTLQINSAFRTVAQQYLLYRWYQQGSCGITAAATPGRSNHESGRAVDVSNYASRVTTMAAHGWAHDVPGDPVHFDHLASPDLRGRDIEAFQRLWNRNNPTDTIGEDGAYGPQTESRLRQAPSTGFALGATCGDRAQAQVTVAQVIGPDRVATGQRAHYTMMLTNTGNVAWPDTAEVRVASGQPSALYDATTWTSSTVVGPLGQGVDVGAMVAVDLDVATPTVSEDTVIDEALTLGDGGQDLGGFHLALTVTAGAGSGSGSGSGDTSGDGSEPDPAPTATDAASTTGGCAAGGGGVGWLALALPGLVLGLRRRR